MAATSVPLEASFASLSLGTCAHLSEQNHIACDDRSVVWTIPNIHRDDVHGIIQLGNSHIVTGSKDGSLVKSSLDGKIITSYAPTDTHGRLDYRKWVTAIARLSTTSWLHGTRDGCVYLWDNNFQIKKTWDFPLGQNHHCKERNLSRIMCFGTFNSSQPNISQFSLGQATQFSFMQTQKENPDQTLSTGQNDWVYVLYPLSTKKMMVVTGPDLALWDNQNGWEGSYYIIKDNSRNPRPFISSVTQVASNARHIACAIFGGDVRIVDYETCQRVINWKEHRERVWSVVNCLLDGSAASSLLATSSDDKTFKLWDVRQSESVFTSKKHIGRVSSLLSYPNHLVAATCPSAPTTGNGATLLCRDLRVLR